MNRPEIVAELSANHGGRYEGAIQLLRAAKDSGADSAKIQVWSPGRMVLDRTYLIKAGAWAGQPLADLYDRCQTPWEWLPALFEEARRTGIELFASVFDEGALAVLEGLNCPRYKIASFEMVDVRLIELVASTGKPMIISTGMATREEIIEAIMAVEMGRVKGDHPLVPINLTMLHCASRYPAPPGILRMTLMSALADLHCKVDVGFSDHTKGATAAIVATALGASMIERHLMLDDDPKVEDAPFSSTPAGFRFLVDQVRAAALMCGQPDAEFGPVEGDELELRRSVYAAHRIPEGNRIMPQDVVTARPALGLSPICLDKLLGHRAKRTIERHTPIRAEDVDLERY